MSTPVAPAVERGDRRRDEGWAGREVAHPSSRTGSGEDELGLDLEGDRLADEHAAALERLVPREPEVLAVHLAGGAEAGTGAAPRVGDRAVELDAQGHGTGDAPDRELAVDHVLAVL